MTKSTKLPDSKLNTKLITLHDDSLASFNLNTIGTSTKNTYIGQFKVKTILSPMEFIKADRLYRELLGPNLHYASSRVQNYAFALSQLKFRIVEFPPFWEDRELNGSHIKDDNIALEIMELAAESEELYRKERDEQAEEIQKILTDKIRKGSIKKTEEVEDKPEEESEE